MFRTGLTALDRSDRSDRGAGLPGGITPSSGLRIGRSIYVFRSSQLDLHNDAVQFAIWQCYPDWFDQFVQIVQQTSVSTNIGCQH